MHDTADPFFEPYDRDEIAYGDVPSAPIAAYLRQVIGRRVLDQQQNISHAIDLGAGAGRDTIALAKAGFLVKAVDLSQRGLDRIMQRARNAGVDQRVTTQVADVRQVDVPPGSHAAIVATTVLDHIPAEDAKALWQKLADGLRPDGMLYVEVHTTEDPGSDQEPGCDSNDPVSETADAVINYFRPNQLARWATDPEARLRILKYEERLEWDYTHGPEHLHGKAILLAVRAGFHPPYYGQPAAFPQRTSQ
ncbi:class I SAM-dependent methyltransferase [Stieleria varia]|uniref:Mg-protoporphyrin IX methyl transferase n=1 Tax=Stieleria varia TaxID=2528005 RepID=A0A5C6B3H2_9BACT|nr:class I SAM-dependent methyltransferase [Stieleria varia]TWU06450.1 Mg-protoporphyrin IX methyl transferase [Stieleria varia]